MLQPIKNTACGLALLAITSNHALTEHTGIRVNRAVNHGILQAGSIKKEAARSNKAQANLALNNRFLDDADLAIYTLNLAIKKDLDTRGCTMAISSIFIHNLLQDADLTFLNEKPHGYLSRPPKYRVSVDQTSIKAPLKFTTFASKISKRISLMPLDW